MIQLQILNEMCKVLHGHQGSFVCPVKVSSFSFSECFNVVSFYTFHAYLGVICEVIPHVSF